MCVKDGVGCIQLNWEIILGEADCLTGLIDEVNAKLQVMMRIIILKCGFGVGDVGGVCEGVGMFSCAGSNNWGSRLSDWFD